MSFAAYRSVLSRPRARQVLLLGLLLRIPIFGTGVLLMLHVVNQLGRSWGEAGLVSAVATIAIAVSGPWRGRLLDKHGLRKVVAPSLVITGSAWAVAPFVGYWPLLVLAGVAGLFVVPIFSVARQGIIAAVPIHERRTALSVDGVAVELAYMSGPAVAVWAGTQWGTAPTLFVVQMLAVLGEASCGCSTRRCARRAPPTTRSPSRARAGSGRASSCCASRPPPRPWCWSAARSRSWPRCRAGASTPSSAWSSPAGAWGRSSAA
ncbi:MFS transporter [Barrientosiimonas endolithica]|nr:MFS transporter [Barrientosiimonas endolithica]